MTAITRRGVLAGATAAVAVATVSAPTPALADDAILLARIQRFHDVYGELQDVWARQKAHRAQIGAMPDCPGPQTWPSGEYALPRAAFLETHDAFRYWDECNRLNEQTGALAKAIFETPAQTARGVLEKLKIAYLAVGDGEETDTGDNDLEAFQDLAAPWMEVVIADFERLSGEARP